MAQNKVRHCDTLQLKMSNWIVKVSSHGGMHRFL